jgi:hypothetical protein
MTENQVSSVGIATGYGLDGRGFESRQVQVISLIAPRPVLRPTQPPTKRVTAAIYMGIKLPGL